MSKKEEKRLSPEEVAAMVSPERTAQTVRLWVKEQGLEATKDKMSGRLMISRYALRKFCKRKGIPLKEQKND